LIELIVAGRMYTHYKSTLDRDFNHSAINFFVTQVELLLKVLERVHKFSLITLGRLIL
jgi:hypothetical protein